MTKQHNLPTATLMFRIARRFRGRYVANLPIWTTIWMLPIIPGIVTLRFFDSLEAGTAGANVGTLATAQHDGTCVRITRRPVDRDLARRKHF